MLIRFYRYYDQMREPYRCLTMILILWPCLVVINFPFLPTVVRIVALFWVLFLVISRYLYIKRPATKKLQDWFDEQKKQGMIDFKVTFNPEADKNATIEELAEECFAMVTAPEFEPERREAFLKWLDGDPNYSKCDTCHSIRHFSDPCEHMKTL